MDLLLNRTWLSFPCQTKKGTAPSEMSHSVTAFYFYVPFTITAHRHCMLPVPGSLKKFLMEISHRQILQSIGANCPAITPCKMLSNVTTASGLSLWSLCGSLCGVCPANDSPGQNHRCLQNEEPRAFPGSNMPSCSEVKFSRYPVTRK